MILLKWLTSSRRDLIVAPPFPMIAPATFDGINNRHQILFWKNISQYFRLFNGHDMTYRMSHTGHGKNKYAIFPMKKGGIFFTYERKFSYFFSVIIVVIINFGWLIWLTDQYRWLDCWWVGVLTGCCWLVSWKWIWSRAFYSAMFYWRRDSGFSVRTRIRTIWSNRRAWNMICILK